MAKRDPYQILGVGRDAGESEVRSAFRRKAKRAHPDAGGSNEEFDKVNWAMRLLTDRGQRDHYDQTGEEKPRVPEARIRAMEILVGKLRQVLDTAGDSIIFVDVIAKLREAVAEGRQAVARDRRTFEQQLARAEKAAARLKGKDGAPSAFMPAMQELLRETRKKLDAVAEGEKTLVAAEEILDGQSFDVEQMGSTSTGGADPTFMRMMLFGGN